MTRLEHPGVLPTPTTLRPRCDHVDENGRLCTAPAGGTTPTSIHRHVFLPTIAEQLHFESHNQSVSNRYELIRNRWGLSPARWHQILNRAIDTAEALEHDAITTNRLLRERDERLARRTARHFNTTHTTD